MADRKIVAPSHSIEQITSELKEALNEAKNKLKYSDRRQFMAQIVKSLGPGGQRRAQRELGWNRNTIIKGLKELNSGIHCYDNFSGRGRKRPEDHLPHLLDDIKAIVEPVSQVDPTFRTDQTYCPLDSIDKVIGLAKTMKWKGKNPFVQIIDGIYKTGVRLTKSTMKIYENMLARKTGLEKWSVDIFYYNQQRFI